MESGGAEEEEAKRERGRRKRKKRKVGKKEDIKVDNGIIGQEAALLHDHRLSD